MSKNIFRRPKAVEELFEVLKGKRNIFVRVVDWVFILVAALQMVV